ncbi:MAG: ATP synthase F1 subunit epsilon [Acidobacteria bacterium RIFCSPLOWO2_12_FULL_54_10]|nr:MAG: ATP synthase F1 subunit epsilon [Acidobacteria bacterium RIFCSPLOWO2_12_FULL_54_10]
MEQKIHLRIVTPNRQLVSEDVDECQIPGREGYLGVLPGHAPLISELKFGELSYRSGKEVHHMAVLGGYLEVLPDQVTVLAETAERSADIDLARAEASRERAERRLKQIDSETDMRRAMVALERALIRIQVASKSR